MHEYVSADRVSAFSEFQTTGAAVETACKEKTVLTCGRYSNAEFEHEPRTAEVYCNDMSAVQIVWHDMLL